MFSLSVCVYSLNSGDISSHFGNIYYTRYCAWYCIYLVAATTYSFSNPLKLVQIRGVYFPIDNSPVVSTAEKAVYCLNYMKTQTMTLLSKDEKRDSGRLPNAAISRNPFIYGCMRRSSTAAGACRIVFYNLS